MPSDFMLKTMNQAHRAIMTISGGKLGWSAGKMPVLELTTTGRRSGKQRGDPADRAVAGRGATGHHRLGRRQRHHPAWFLNLRDEPAVTVRTEDGTRPMTARIVSGQERTEIWDQVTARYKNYADYQSKTDREIPVVVLEPTA